MDSCEFEKLVQKVKKEKPILFGLDSDCIPNVEVIELVEKYYEIKFPHSYKNFLLQYGGGYFAFTVVYSMDENSSFYIKNNVEAEFIRDKKFVPVIDLETGDLAGFRVNDGICEELVAIYDHEEGTITDLNLNFFDILAQYGLDLK